MTARQKLIAAATEAGDLDYAAYIAALPTMRMSEILRRLAFYTCA